MQIRVDKLRKNLALLQPVVPRKATLPIITNVRLRDGKLTGTDLETKVSIDLPQTQGNALLLPLKQVMELLKFVPGDEMLTLEVTPKPNSKNSLVKLSWNSGSAAYETKNVRDYPEIAIKEPQPEGSLNGDRLIDALVAALPYCASEATRPVLSGVTLYLGNVLQVAGADGYRLSYQSLNQFYPIEEKIVIPAGTVSILENLWHKEPSQVGLATDLVSQISQARQFQLSLGDYTEETTGNKPVPRTMLIQFGNITLIGRLIMGTPPDHLALLNNFQEPVKVKFLAPELYQAVRRVQGIAQAGTGIVRLQWSETQMTVSAHNAETGDVQAAFPVRSGSNPGRTALNVRYLLEYLNGKDGLITLGKADGNAPALFHYGAKPIVAIMPMQVQWEDERPNANREEPKVETTVSKAEATAGNPEVENEAKVEETEEIGKDKARQKSSTEPVTAGVTAAETAVEKPAETRKTRETPKRRIHRKKT